MRHLIENMAVWIQRYPEGNPWHYSGIREFRRDSHAPSLVSHWPCSNRAAT